MIFGNTPVQDVECMIEMDREDVGKCVKIMNFVFKTRNCVLQRGIMNQKRGSMYFK